MIDQIGKAVRGSKWGVGGVLTGLGLLVLTSQVPHDAPGLQEFAGGAGLVALVGGVVAIVKRFGGGAGKDGAAS